MTDRTYTAFLWIVTIGWAANIAAAMTKWNGYQPDPYINVIFMGTVGAALIAKSRKPEKPKHKRVQSSDSTDPVTQDVEP